MFRKLTLVLLLLHALVIQASHMSGGEIFWECIGPDQYRITMKIYRDCAGIAVDPAYNLQVQSPCGNTTVVVTTPGGTEISQLCDLELPNSTCNGGTLPGIQEYIYTGVVTLPPCDSWSISYTNIYRNAAIVNLQNPAAQRTYINAVINTADAPCNDSPQFTNTAIPYVCLGMPYTYSFGVFDPEADSVSYHFISAMGLNGTPLNYVPPHTPAQPIPGITLDPATGEVNFTLNQLGNWVVNVQVRHWVNGQVVGTVMRDMQFVAYPCDNTPPDPTTGLIDNLSGAAALTGPRTIDVCESGSFCFDLVIQDPNPANVLSAFTNVQQNLPGSTFSYSGTNPITASVCWTAAPGTSGFFPFIINVNDGACPIYAFQTYVYTVRVLPGLFGELTAIDADCANPGSLTAEVSVGTGPFTYAWSNGSTSSTISDVPGDYSVVINDAAGCVSQPIAGTIGYSPGVAVALAGNDLSLCPGTGAIQLNGTVLNASGGSWSGGSGSFSDDGPTPTYTPSAADMANGSIVLTLTASGIAPCPDGTDQITLAFDQPFPQLTITTTDVLCNGGATGSATALVNGTGMSFLWNDPLGQTSATATGLIAGDYQLTVISAEGCDTTVSVTINEPGNVIILDMAGNAEWCAGDGSGVASVTATGGTAPYDYLWSNGGTTQTIAVTSGVFSVTVSDSNGCQSQPGMIDLGQSDIPAMVNAGSDIQTCLGSGPILLAGTATATNTTWSGGSGTFSGNGLNASYTPTATEIQTGSVQLTLSGVNGGSCPAAQDQILITFVNDLAGVSVQATEVLCNGDGNGTASVIGAPSDATFLWNDAMSQTSATAIGLPGGTYQVLVTDAMGCDTTLVIGIEEPASVIILDMNGNAELCAGDGTGMASVIATGGTQPYTYQWSNGAAGQSTPATSGILTVLVSDMNGCLSNEGSIDLGPSGTPATANAGPDLVVCDPAQPIALFGNANDASSVYWGGGSGTFIGSGVSVLYQPSANEVAAGSLLLTLTAISSGACPPDVDVVQIALAPGSPGLSGTATDVTCAGTATGTAEVVGASVGATFLWNDPAGQTSPLANALHAGTYEVLITDTIGCDTTLVINVGTPPPLSISGIAGTGEGCAGAGDGQVTVLVEGGTMPYSFAWNTGDLTATIPATSGTYEVWVNDANGCGPLSASIELDAGAAPNQAIAGPDQVICEFGLPIQLQGSVVNANTGYWSGGAGTFAGTDLQVSYLPSEAEWAAGGAYLVLTTVGNSACPPGSDTVHIALSNALLDATLTATDVGCYGASDGVLTFSPVSPGLDYDWGLPTLPSSPEVSDLAPGSYGLVVTDTLGCVLALSAEIVEPSALEIMVDEVNDLTCTGGSDGLVSLSINGGTPGYAVLWNTGLTGTLIQGVGAGEYSAVVTDAAGCTSAVTVTVGAPPPIVLVSDVPDTVCVNAPVLLSAQANGGNGGYQFDWGSLGSGASVSATFSVSQTVTVTVTDQYGCAGPVLTHYVEVLDLSNAQLMTYGDTLVCPGGIAEVGALLTGYPDDVTYSWPGLGVTGSGPFSVPVDSDMLLQVIVTDNCGTQVNGQVVLQVGTMPNVQVPPIIAQGCAPLSVDLPALGLPDGTLYQWDLGNGTTSSAPSPTVNYGVGTHTISLSVTVPGGCLNGILGTGQVIVHGPPSIDFTASPWITDIDNGQVVFTSNSPNTIVSHEWTFGDGGTASSPNPVHTFSEIGTFNVELWIMDANGCTASVEHPVTITPVYDIVLPNAFTPNNTGGNGGTWTPGDLNNDVFYPFIRFVDEFKMRVFNRWGELVFESNDLSIGWDGYYRGQISPQDVYVVQTYVRFVDGKEVQQLSDLTLFR